MSARERILARESHDGLARVLSRFRLRPVPGETLFPRARFDLHLDECLELGGRARYQGHTNFSCVFFRSPILARQTLLPDRYYDGPECPSSFGRRRSPSPPPLLPRRPKARPSKRRLRLLLRNELRRPPRPPRPRSVVPCQSPMR